MWEWDPILRRYVWTGPRTITGLPITDTLPPNSPPDTGVGGTQVGRIQVGGTRDSGNDPHAIDPDLFLKTSDPLGGWNEHQDWAWWILTHQPDYHPPGIDPNTGRDANDPLDKNKLSRPWTGPDNSPSCPPPYNPNSDDPCSKGDLGKKNREKIKTAWSNMRSNLQKNWSFLDTMSKCSPGMKKFANCLEKMAGMDPNDPVNTLIDQNPPANLDIGCDNVNLHSQGIMGLTAKNEKNGRIEITLSLDKIDDAADKYSFNKGEALQSTILHELAHACDGSELDAKYIETLFYPHTSFNKINYNDKTYGVICDESKQKYKGSDKNILQGNFIQWNKDKGYVTCDDENGQLLEQNEGSMSEQTKGLFNCP